MFLPRDRSPSISLRLPVALLVVAATAVPVEVRPPELAVLDVGRHADDMARNVVGYVPLGIVLAGLGRVRVLVIAAAISGLAELSQVFIMHRFPSPVDLATNVSGAALGMYLASRWRISSPALTINQWTAGIAGALVCLHLGSNVWLAASDEAREPAINTRGLTTPGEREADWRFERFDGESVADDSGHRLSGLLADGADVSDGRRGGALRLDGRGAHVALGDPPALRLAGSLTISAWINASDHPIDDAAIVSAHSRRGLGYQLDTTVDRRIRSVGFKLADACGELLARYGRTPLELGTWYHVAGVYDAHARTLDVFVNGRLDNGYLHGTVMGSQRPSNLPAYIGRRSEPAGFHFAGLIDDVRIYSRALTAGEIEADMHGDPPLQARASPHSSMDVDDVPTAEGDRPCPRSGRGLALLPGTVAGLGLAAAIATIGVLATQSAAMPLLPLAVSLGAGLVVVLTLPSTLPAFNQWTLPLSALAGGLAAVLSRRRLHEAETARRTGADPPVRDG